MTEYDLFIQCVPMIAEMVVKVKRMTEKQYQEWKQEQENALKASGQKTNSFALKVLKVIDTCRGREIAA